MSTTPGSTPPRQTRLLIVDDSALIRKLLSNLFSRQPDFEVSTARDGIDAMQQLHRFQPDVISLDVNLPGQDGLECLNRIMVERPTPVVMFSALTEKGAASTAEAMALGAVDFLAKPAGATSATIEKLSRELVRKIRGAAQAKVRRSRGLHQRMREQNQLDVVAPTAPKLDSARCPGVVIVGVSTGGPRTLEEVLPDLPTNFPWPVIVAQHMPSSFTAALTKRMDSLCKLSVVEVTRPMPLQAGQIYIAMGDSDILVGRRSQGVVVMPAPPSEDYLWHPSVDALVKSAHRVFPAQRVIGVLLTGMGHDGAAEMTLLRQSGGHTIAESEESAVVFGMPCELIRREGAEVVLPAERIPRQLTDWLNS